MFEWLLDPSAWMALATLTLLEIVLGIDNIIFISILVSKLPRTATTSSCAGSGGRHGHSGSAPALAGMGHAPDFALVQHV